MYGFIVTFFLNYEIDLIQDSILELYMIFLFENFTFLMVVGFFFPLKQYFRFLHKKWKLFSIFIHFSIIVFVFFWHICGAKAYANLTNFIKGFICCKRDLEVIVILTNVWNHTKVFKNVFQAKTWYFPWY